MCVCVEGEGRKNGGKMGGREGGKRGGREGREGGKRREKERRKREGRERAQSIQLSLPQQSPKTLGGERYKKIDEICIYYNILNFSGLCVENV